MIMLINRFFFLYSEIKSFVQNEILSSKKLSICYTFRRININIKMENLLNKHRFNVVNLKNTFNFISIKIIFNCINLKKQIVFVFESSIIHFCWNYTSFVLYHTLFLTFSK